MDGTALFVLFAVLIAAVVGLSIYLSFLRRKELAAVAQRLGFRFHPGGNFGFERMFAFFELFSRGSGRRSYNLIEGREEETDIRMFDYVYHTGSGKNRRTHRKTVCLLEIPVKRSFPHVVIRPEGLLDKFASAVGFNDIDFESVEFSRKFFVKSRERRFAYDLVDPRMMEFLLRVDRVCIEVGSRAMLVHYNRSLSPKRWPGLLNIGRSFIEKIPERLMSGSY